MPRRFTMSSLHLLSILAWLAAAGVGSTQAFVFTPAGSVGAFGRFQSRLVPTSKFVPGRMLRGGHGGTSTRAFPLRSPLGCRMASLQDVILVCGVAFAGYKVYEGMQNGELGASAGVTVAKLQVAVNCDDRGPSSLLGTLARLGQTADTSSQAGVSSLVSDTALALLRKEVDWMSAALETASAKSAEQGEQKFGEFSLQERAKIERETVNKVGGADKSEARGKEDKADSFGSGTVAVVTLILALEGQELKPVTDLKSLKSTLMTLGSDFLGNDALLAAEVLWTPEEPWERISPDEVTLDYPNLLIL